MLSHLQIRLWMSLINKEMAMQAVALAISAMSGISTSASVFIFSFDAGCQLAGKSGMRIINDSQSPLCELQVSQVNFRLSTNPF